MPPTHASPNIRYDEVDLRRTDDRIRVFEDLWRGLILGHARVLLERQDGQFAAMQLVLPYFESIESYRTGLTSYRKSEEFFKRGFLALFPAPSEVHPDQSLLPNNFMLDLAKAVYVEMRCGFFHDGLIRYRIQIVPTADAPPIDVALGEGGGILQITIGARQLLDAIEGHLAYYLTEVRSSENTVLRRAFDQTWDRNHKPNEAFLSAMAGVPPPPAASQRV